MVPTFVVDAHVHFWDPTLLIYPWLDGVPTLRRPRLPADYKPLIDGSVDKVIVVEANCALDASTSEVAFVGRLAVGDPRIVAMVAQVNLFDDTHRDAMLERLANTDQVVGIRQNIQGHPGSICRLTSFVRGVQRAGRLGLTFDLCATADQLVDVADLVRRCPGTQFVLDHCGKPAIRDDAFEPWAAAVAELAAYDHLYCKLSGLLTEARPDRRTSDTLRPWAEHALDRFGTRRLMYGSDWPIVDAAGGIAAWRAFIDEFTATWAAPDRRDFYADTALHFYGVSAHDDR
jgi:L-fuconolactonase